MGTRVRRLDRGQGLHTAIESKKVECKKGFIKGSRPGSKEQYAVKIKKSIGWLRHL